MPFTVYGELTANGQHIILLIQGDVAHALKQLKRITPAIKSSTHPNAFNVPATWGTVVQLTAQLGAVWLYGPVLKAWMREQVITRTATTNLKAVVKKGAPEPRDYQKVGASLIGKIGKALICDEAGAGKTLTALLGLMELDASCRFVDKSIKRQINKETNRFVVICPNSVIDAWLAAIASWTHYTAVAWRGTVKQREKLPGTADIYVVGYGLVVKDAHPIDGGLLTDMHPQAVISDEFHFLKTPTALRSKAVRKLAHQATAFIGLSGTPITHHAGDLWPTLDAMEHETWPSRERYVHRFLLTALTDYGEDIIGINPQMEPEFRRCLVGQYRRLAKADVLQQLPPKIHSVREVELPGPARRSYDSMRKTMLAELPSGEELPVMGTLAQLQRLLQLSSSSAQVTSRREQIVDKSTNLLIDNIKIDVSLCEPSWKLDALVDVLDERPEQQVLVFAPSAQLIHLAVARLDRQGLSVGIIVGGQRPEERQAVIDQFQAGKLSVVCATTGAGGVGITLTAASTVVFLQRPWSLVEAEQAEDRAHRIGSERHESIEIIDIIAKDTVDQHVREILREKAGALSELLADRRVVERCLGGV